jgi:hypothetical protein
VVPTAFDSTQQHDIVDLPFLVEKEAMQGINLTDEHRGSSQVIALGSTEIGIGHLGL